MSFSSNLRIPSSPPLCAANWPLRHIALFPPHNPSATMRCSLHVPLTPSCAPPFARALHRRVLFPPLALCLRALLPLCGSSPARSPPCRWPLPLPSVGGSALPLPRWVSPSFPTPRDAAGPINAWPREALFLRWCLVAKVCTCLLQ